MGNSGSSLALHEAAQSCGVAHWDAFERFGDVECSSSSMTLHRVAPRTHSQFSQLSVLCVFAAWVVCDVDVSKSVQAS